MADALRPGSTFVGLDVERLLASGGMGSVYLATDPVLGRRVAVKVVASAFADDLACRERFLREARTVAAMEHPAIVPVYGAGDSEGRLYLVMRFMDEGSLADLIRRQAPLSLRETVRLLAPVADALDAAHAAGLVHRDVKPSNILLSGGSSCLADFGLAAVTSPADAGAVDQDIAGTLGYMSPEQLEGDEVGAQADQYGLACVAFVCLTGRRPFEGASDLAVVYGHLQDPPPSAAEHQSELPAGVDEVLARGLAKGPSDRYGSCRELIDALAATPATSTAIPRRGSRYRAGVVSALVAVLVVAGAVLLTFQPGGPAPDAAPRGDGVAVFDAVGRSVTKIMVGAGPLAMTAGDGTVWVVNAEDHTISRIDAAGRAVRGSAFALQAASPVGLAYGGGELWVATGSKSTTDTTDFGAITDAVVRVDPATDQEDAPIPLAARPPWTRGFHRSGHQIAYGAGSVWVIDSNGALERIDATGHPRVVADPQHQAQAIAFGQDRAWVLGERVEANGTHDGPWVWSIDPATNLLEGEMRLQTRGAADLAVGAGSVWVAAPWDGVVMRLLIGAPQSPRTIPVQGATAVSYDAGTNRVWVTDPAGSTVRAIDPDDPDQHRAGPPIRVAGAPQSVAVAGGLVFTSVIDAETQPMQQRPVENGDVAHAGCPTVWADPAKPPDLLIVGDYSLDDAGSRVNSQAALSVLREHHFRAGTRSIGYQPCNDSTMQVCADYGRAYAHAAHVVAVISDQGSPCVEALVPTLQAATGGPVAVIGTVSTADVLTSSAYPNFDRVTSTDSELTAAGVDVFVDQRATRVVLLSSDCCRQYERAFVPVLRRSASGRVSIVEEADYHEPDADPVLSLPYGARAEDLARRVAQLGATGVYLLGFPGHGYGALVQALRAQNPQLLIVEADGSGPVSDAIAVAGPAAKGVYFTSLNPPNGALPPVGQRWLRRFAATQLGTQVPTSAVQSAAAMEALLDAIERSDGSRASVATALRGIDLPGSVIGPLHFTPQGDITSCRTSVYQIEGDTFLVPDLSSDLQGARFVKQVPCHAPTSVR